MSGKVKFFKKLRQQTQVILEQNRFLCFLDALSDMCILTKTVNETLQLFAQFLWNVSHKAASDFKQVI